MATKTRGTPYPIGSDANDAAGWIDQLAQWVDDRPGVAALTTTQRNALTGAGLWDGRIVLNTTTDRLNRYDLGTTTWVQIPDSVDIAALLTATTPTTSPAVTGVVGVAAAAARADHVHPAPAWAAYTPAWTGTVTNPTLGNGTLTGALQRFGKLVFFDIVLIIGTTTTMGSGRWDFSLPTTPNARYLSLTAPLGHALALDFSARMYQGVCVYVGSGKVTGHRDIGTESTFTPTSPFTFVDTDKIHLHGFYEEA